MTKNYILAAVLSLIVIVGSSFLQLKLFPPQQPQQKPTVPAGTEENAPIVPQMIQPAQTIFSATQNEPVEQALAEQTFELQTELVNVQFTNRGGDIISYELRDHLNKGNPIQMADNISAMNRGFSVAFGDSTMPITNELFTVRRISEYSIGFYKSFTVKNIQGQDSSFTLVKQYTFKPTDYLFQLDIIITSEDGLTGFNFSNAAYTLRTPPQIGPHFDRKKDRYENRTFMSYTNDKRKKQILNEGQTKVYDNPYTWTGVAGKYFAVLVVPPNTGIEKAIYSTQIEVNNYANAQVFLTRSPVMQPKIQDTYYVYMGPRTESSLAKYNNAIDNDWELSGLHLNDSIESTGILSWLETILKWMMEMFYKFIPNWGVSIILMTILLKFALYPLTKKSSVSTLKMQELQPRIQEIQAKYKGEPEKMNAEMAKMYKETGYNPLSGCLPLLIQFPLIFAMFNLFNNYFEFRGAMFIPGWIPDLSQGDSIYTFENSINLIFWRLSDIRVLPVIYVISQLLFGKVTQASTTAQNTSMKLMMYGMPLIFFFIFYDAPSGLIIYWTVSNILQLVQQVTINKMMHRKKQEVAVAPVQKTRKKK